MTYVRSFEDFFPPKRSDGIPFTEVLIREGATSSYASSVLIDTKALTPVDSDPNNPLSRSFTTSLATIAEDGWYWIVWKQTDGALFISDPFQIASPSLSPIELLTRSEMPSTWDGLAQDRYLGLATLRLRVSNVKATALPAATAQADEATYSGTLSAYISKKAALDLIPTGIDYWMRQKTTLSATGTNETKSLPDPISALRDLAKRLAAEIAVLAGNPDVTQFGQLFSDAPAVSGNDDNVLLTNNPYAFPPAFGVDTGTTTVGA